jgi:plastocyanin
MQRASAALVIGVLVLGAVMGQGAAQSAGSTWKVAIGGETPDHGIQAQIFAPSLITIHAGDTVTWSMASVFEHTVTFLSGARPPAPVVPEEGGKFRFNPMTFNPQGGPAYGGKGVASSGFLQAKGTYSLTFTKPGKYAYVCLLHPGMIGTVVVLAPGKKLPATQAELDRAGAVQVKSALARGGPLLTNMRPSVIKAAKSATYVSPMVGSRGAASVLRFLPESLTVKTGDTVRWEMRDPMELHTITFSGSEQPPDFIQPPQMQPQGPPKIYFNPKGVVRLGGFTHAGDGYYNSGFMAMDVPGPKTYSLTFTRPGTYTYWCVVHVPQGMKGVINVQ